MTGKWETFRFQYLEVDRDVSDLDEGNIIYTLTSEAKELFLNTNEIQKQLPISIQQLLVELLIEKGDLKSALRMLESLNHRVLTLLKEEKSTRTSFFGTLRKPYINKTNGGAIN